MYLLRSKFLGYVLAVAIGSVPAVLPFESIAKEDDSSDQASAEEMFFDGLVVRPLMLAGTVLGTAAFVITPPLRRSVTGTRWKLKTPTALPLFFAPLPSC